MNFRYVLFAAACIFLADHNASHSEFFLSLRYFEPEFRESSELRFCLVEMAPDESANPQLLNTATIIKIGHRERKIGELIYSHGVTAAKCAKFWRSMGDCTHRMSHC